VCNRLLLLRQLDLRWARELARAEVGQSDVHGRRQQFQGLDLGCGGSSTAIATDGSNPVYLINVPPGLVDVIATPQALGKPSSHSTVVVAAGAPLYVPPIASRAPHPPVIMPAVPSAEASAAIHPADDGAGEAGTPAPVKSWL
jgi:hypothetical protein